jgi:hypothetical protein
MKRAKALRRSAGSFAGKRLHLVQLAGPVRPDWHREILNTGVQIISYVPQNTYLVYGDATGLAQLQTLAATSSYIQWDGGYLDEYKIHPKARVVNAKGEPQKTDTDTFAIQLVDDPQPNAASLQLIDRHKLAPIINQFKILNYLNVIVRLPAGTLAGDRGQPEVVSIHPAPATQKRDERQDQILAGNLLTNVPNGPAISRWLRKGFVQAQFTASGFAVDLTDSGIDNATSAPGHFGVCIRKEIRASLAASFIIVSEGTPNIRQHYSRLRRPRQSQLAYHRRL